MFKQSLNVDGEVLMIFFNIKIIIYLTCDKQGSHIKYIF